MLRRETGRNLNYCLAIIVTAVPLDLPTSCPSCLLRAIRVSLCGLAMAGVGDSEDGRVEGL